MRRCRPAPDRLAIDGRVSKIAGQIRGLERMVERDQGCVEILTQVAAVKAALNQCGILLLAHHVETCRGGKALTKVELRSALHQLLADPEPSGG